MKAPTAPLPAPFLSAIILDCTKLIAASALEVASLLEFISKPVTCPLYLVFASAVVNTAFIVLFLLVVATNL